MSVARGVAIGPDDTEPGRGSEPARTGRAEQPPLAAGRAASPTAHSSGCALVARLAAERPARAKGGGGMSTGSPGDAASPAQHPSRAGPGVHAPAQRQIPTWSAPCPRNRCRPRRPVAARTRRGCSEGPAGGTVPGPGRWGRWQDQIGRSSGWEQRQCTVSGSRRKAGAELRIRSTGRWVQRRRSGGWDHLQRCGRYLLLDGWVQRRPAVAPRPLRSRGEKLSLRPVGRWKRLVTHQCLRPQYRG